MPILASALAFAVLLLFWQPTAEESIEGRRGILVMLGLLTAGLLIARLLSAMGRPAFDEAGVFGAALFVVLLGYLAIVFPPWILRGAGGKLFTAAPARMGLRVLYAAIAMGGAWYVVDRHARVVAALERCASGADATIPDEELRPPAGRFQADRPAYTCRQLRGK
jgi:hypothetical protein